MQRNNEAHNAVIESLTEALLQLMEKKPLAEIKISELCTRAGVSRISFYRNYNSMHDILVRYLVKCTDDWWAEFIKKGEENYRKRFLVELIAQYRKNEKLIKLLYKNDVSYIIKEHIFTCCDPNPDRDEADSYSRAVLAGALYGVIDEWIRRGMGDLPQGFSLMNLVDAMPKFGGNNEK